MNDCPGGRRPCPNRSNFGANHSSHGRPGTRPLRGPFRSHLPSRLASRLTDQTALSPREQLLSWLNGFLQTDYAKIDDLGDGIGYLLVLDAIFPGQVPLRKANFAPASDRERERNLTLVQEVLDKQHVRRDVAVARMAAERFTENLDFLQWLYGFLNKHYPDAPRTYRAVERRKEVMDAQRGKGKRGKGRAPGHAASAPLSPSGNLMPRMSAASDLIGDGRQSAAYVARQHAAQAQVAGGSSASPNVDHVAGRQRRGELERLVTQLEGELMGMMSEIDGVRHELAPLRSERDFYFDKLRDVEELCNLYPSDSPRVQEARSILFHTTPAFETDEP